MLFFLNPLERGCMRRMAIFVVILWQIRSIFNCETGCFSNFKQISLPPHRLGKTPLSICKRQGKLTGLQNT